ncbi:MAG: transporter [Thiobacillus sp.]|uniref:transporter n=1 Tax=Thiobacillus sp. TaxID=924 RepID=UPI0027355A2A|nr:transporter [Thiobacillus sp.]MDP3584771.1 transporter [Thiobacillus sp.]
MNRTPLLALRLAALSAGLAVLPAAASDAELAKQALNPIAALISLPMQLNYDENIGPAERGEKWQLNVQPVIPFSIGADWNLISRTIVPLVSQEDVVPGAGTDSGVGDITQSLFFSPKKPTAGGWIWGAGPVLLLPTGSEDRLTADKWGLGPTAVVLRQENGWTYGALANHIWSVAGDDDRRDISATFLQPFVSYTTKTLTSFTLNTESTYDWKAEQWSVPINFMVSQMLKVGNQPLTLQAGARYWADSPDGAGPEGWGFRLAVTLLFPK